MSYRFFLEMAPEENKATLVGDQAHHAIHVMRYKVGDSIVLFDGKGNQYQAEIEEASKKKLLLAITGQSRDSKELSTKITLAVALPKGDRQKFLIEKLVELGVSQLVPLKTSRSVAIANEKVIQRLEKQVVEACKQCERNTLMQISASKTIRELSDSLSGNESCFVADPYEGKSISAIDAKVKDAVVVIGPEGGLDEGELAELKELGFQPIQAGSAILRVETAAIAFAAILGIGREG